MGCHTTAEEAANQIYAINESEGNIDEKEMVTNNGGMGIKKPQAWPGTAIKEPKMKKNDVTEGDFVVAMTSEGALVGQVEHVMREGGRYGEVGNPYSVESTPENPAVAIRMLEEEEDGTYCYTPYSIGALMSDVTRIERPNISTEEYEEEDEYEDKMEKAEGYAPPAGARAAARRAIKIKEDGKANGAGTVVGWTRARQLANGETLSLSTVKRMYSYFSRHEVDKKGKDWGNQANPSNGYIMWLAWGGDAGFSWSRGIVNRMKDKALFADFGKNFTRSTGMAEIFKAVGVGSMVSWNSSGGRAEGKITRIIRDGRYNVPGTEVTVTGTPEDPAAVIRLYRDGKPTDTIVAHKLKTLRGK
jgi:hypothetical protein